MTLYYHFLLSEMISFTVSFLSLPLPWKFSEVRSPVYFFYYSLSSLQNSAVQYLFIQFFNI